MNRFAVRPLVALLALVSAAKAAEATTFRVDYTITLAGLTLGNANLTGAVDGERYELRMRAQLTGLAGLFTASGRGGADSAGAISGTRLLPSAFTATGRSGSAERTVRMILSSGTAGAVSIEPPFEERPDLEPRVPITDADKRAIVDPLSGVLVVAAARPRPLDPANCDRRIPVFDGTQRFDIILSHAESHQVRKPGYSGEVLVCNARYVPIGGHRPSRTSVKFMAENRDISVWFAPVDGTRALAPLRISVRTLLGTTVIEADKWSVD